jgi:hypothetical protein
MGAHRSRLVRVMSEEEIVSITGTLPYATSIGRNWIEVEVHRYRISGPAQTKEFRLPQLAIFLPHADHSGRVRQEVGDEVTTKDVRKDAVTIAPAALTRRASIERPHELTAIFLGPLMFSNIARAETGMCCPEIMPSSRSLIL